MVFFFCIKRNKNLNTPLAKPSVCQSSAPEGQASLRRFNPGATHFHSQPCSVALCRGGKTGREELLVLLIIYQLAARILMCGGIFLSQQGLCTLAWLLGESRVAIGERRHVDWTAKNIWERRNSTSCSS